MALVAYPEFLQTKTYSAQQLRHLFARLGLQEGVYGATDCAVSQRGAGANMSVDVAAGDALVQGDDVTRQGLYHVVNDGVVNVAIGAAHGTLPRLDQIILRIYDASVVGVSDLPLIEVLPGTPSSGATIDTRTGAAALPNNAIRLADVLVGAAVATVPNSVIRDRRPWARGAKLTIVRSSGDIAVSNLSQTAIDATNLRPRLELSGAPLAVRYYGQGQHANPDSNMIFSLVLTALGVDTDVNMWQSRHSSVATGGFGLPLHIVQSPPVGSVRIEPRAAVNAGTMTIKAGTTYGLVMEFEELLGQNAANGTV